MYALLHVGLQLMFNFSFYSSCGLGYLRCRVHDLSSRRHPAPGAFNADLLSPFSSFVISVSVHAFLSVLIQTLQCGVAQVYNYHPILSTADAEAPDESLGTCAICMEIIHNDKHEENTSGGRGLLHRVSGNDGRPARGRKTYSLAPCHHLFVRSTLTFLPAILLQN